MTNGTDSHGPAHSRTNGVTPMSNVDVSVLIKPLSTEIDQSMTDLAVGSLLEQGRQGKLTHMRTDPRTR